jgi:FkbM family methyltransferase
LIVDVGANRGQSIAAFRKFAPDCHIVAFEPEPRSAARLTSQFRRDHTITIHDCALGQQSGVATFFIPTYGRWNCDGMSATDRQEATQWLRDPNRMLLFNEAKLTITEHPIECRTLDSYDFTPRLIKLHAQGAELAILRGSKHTISHWKPALMCAFPSAAVTDLLAGWGYRPHVYKSRRFSPGIAKHPVTFTWYLTEEHGRQLSLSQ